MKRLIKAWVHGEHVAAVVYDSESHTYTYNIMSLLPSETMGGFDSAAAAEEDAQDYLDDVQDALAQAEQDWADAQAWVAQYRERFNA